MVSMLVYGFDGKSTEILELLPTYMRQHLPIGRSSIPNREKNQKMGAVESNSK